MGIRKEILNGSNCCRTKMGTLNTSTETFANKCLTRTYSRPSRGLESGETQLAEEFKRQLLTEAFCAKLELLFTNFKASHKWKIVVNC